MSEAKMQRPAFRNEINLNTILLALTLIGSGVGWGVTWQTMKSGQDRNAEAIVRAQGDIARLNAEVRSAISDINGNMKTFADLPYRVTALETQFASMTGTQRELERALSQLASDMSVTREIVERLDPQRSRYGGAR